ncbi:hypothetical protein [Paenibacillus odorifer]|uniref:DUF4367 domain-containing protein n=1 Tax=Paenibacillus odorifer TaxID=189426 RepID=A0A1R0XWR7_9BACL|nr:hypothetical protein [Paenibacillus odorifer]OMD39554.1 hypothetical protein BSK52_16375 [Paenibacillus odorifer]
MIKKSAVITGLSLLVLMSAVSGTAGAVPAGSNNKSKATAPIEQNTPVSPTIEALIAKENIVPLKAGEVKVLYVNDKKSNPDETLSIRYMPYRFSSTNEAAQKLSSLSGKSLLIPVSLPEDYKLQDVVLNPVLPKFFSAEYKALRDQVKAKAQAAGKKVISQSFKWSDTETSITYLRNGERLNLKSAPAYTLPEGVTLAQLPGDQDENLTINGVEAVYTVFGPHHGDLKVQLVWSSADGSIDYTLTNTKNTAQTKAELETIVTSLTAQ